MATAADQPTGSWETQKLVLESFPLSAWRSLDIDGLPAKSKATPSDISSRPSSLGRLVSLSIADTPTHDELQAIVSGLAGLAFHCGKLQRCALAGISPSIQAGRWREGFIINPTISSCEALSNLAPEPSALES